jgi:hypothetical protein
MDKRGMNKLRSGKRPMAIVAGLVILLGAVCVRFLMPSPSKAAASAAARRGKNEGPPQPPGPALAQPLSRLQMDWPMDLARDPFTSAVVFPPPVKPTPTQPEVEDEAKIRAAKTEELIRAIRANVKLNGTFLGAQPQAIINGKPCRVGDTVHGFVIKHIGGRDVIVEKDGIQLLVTTE